MCPMTLLYNQPLFDDPQHDPQARALITTREFGVVHPKHPDFASQIDRLRQIAHIDAIVAPSLAMKTGVADMVQDPASLKQTDITGFFRTIEQADGIVIPQGRDAIHGRVAALVMVADSGVVKILAPDGRIAVLNLSLECIDPPEGDSIVTRAIRQLITSTRDQVGFTADDLSVEIGNCAGPCCYGINPDDPKRGEANRERLRHLQERWGWMEDVVGTVEYPPRAGWASIDLAKVARMQALREEVGRVASDVLCTSHEGLSLDDVKQGSTQGAFYSHTRGAAANVQPEGWNERQAVLVYGLPSLEEDAETERQQHEAEPVTV